MIWLSYVKPPEVSSGCLVLSGRDVKNTWPKIHAGYARWHVKEIGASPITTPKLEQLGNEDLVQGP